METIEAVSRTYRGILIFETISGFVIFGAQNQKYTFDTQSEAEAFIDAWFAMQQVLIQK